MVSNQQHKNPSYIRLSMSGTLTTEPFQTQQSRLLNTMCHFGYEFIFSKRLIVGIQNDTFNV